MTEIRLTTSQLIVLLNIYRGTYRLHRAIGTTHDDVNLLVKHGLVGYDDANAHTAECWTCSDRGNKFVRELLSKPVKVTT